MIRATPPWRQSVVTRAFVGGSALGCRGGFALLHGGGQQSRGAGQMGLEDHCGAGAILRPEGGEERPMFPVERGAVAKHQSLDQPVSIDSAQEAVNQFPHVGAMVEIVNQLMELDVMRSPRRPILVRLRQVEHPFGLIELLGSERGSGPSDGGRFENDADFVDLADFAGTEGADGCPPVGLVRHQALGLEPAKRFADRNVAHVKLGGDLILGEGLTGLEVTGRDGFPENLGDHLMGGDLAASGKAILDLVEVHGSPGSKS